MLKPLVILKTGRYTDSEGRTYDITTDVLEDIATHTAPETAPLVKGHPKEDAPAMGWVQHLTVEDEKLWAVFTEITEEFQEEIRNGDFKNLSASFYLPDAPANPIPGHYCLRHVGALGAQRPAIPGLSTLQEAVSFSEGLLSIQQEEPQENLLVRLAKCEAESLYWQKRCEELLLRIAVEQALIAWEQQKELDPTLREGLVDKSMSLVASGQSPEEAVATFAENLPPRIQRLHHRFDAPQGKSFADFSAPLVFGENFAAKKAEFEKKGLSPSQAYDKAAQELGL